ncbi:hypothetical protein [Hydrogenimonas sp.]
MLEKILKQYGIDKVSARTRISKKHLAMLVEKNFEGFSKPQAYGFVSILQREYGDDFDELKKELDAWFCEGEECKEEIFVTKDEQSGLELKKIVVAAVVILILAAAALYFVPKEGGMGSATPAAPAAKAEKSVTQQSGSVPEKQESEAPKAPEKEKAQETAAPERPAAVAKPAEAVSAAAQTPQESGEPAPYVPMENAVITPVVKLWFGVIDLKTKKRTAKTTADPYEIESKGRKLLITGHGRFEISDAFGNLFKYNDAKKHYFLIDDGMVKEIPVAEFRRLNGGKVW